jgi:hypothetical protein
MMGEFDATSKISRREEKATTLPSTTAMQEFAERPQKSVEREGSAF